MIEEGLFDLFPCDGVFAMHNKPDLAVGHMAVRPGPILASADRFEITVKGFGTHAAYPHRSIDPFVIGAQITLALQTIVSRNVDPLDSAVVTIGFMRGGSAFNVIPADLTLGGTVRTFRPEVRDLIERRIGEIAHGTAATFGATADAPYHRGYPPTVNDATEAEFAAAVAAEVCGADAVSRTHPPSMGGEDFSYFLNARPGAMLWLGNGLGEAAATCTTRNTTSTTTPSRPASAPSSASPSASSRARVRQGNGCPLSRVRERVGVSDCAVVRDCGDGRRAHPWLLPEGRRPPFAPRGGRRPPLPQGERDPSSDPATRQIPTIGSPPFGHSTCRS